MALWTGWPDFEVIVESQAMDHGLHGTGKLVGSGQGTERDEKNTNDLEDQCTSSEGDMVATVKEGD